MSNVSLILNNMKRFVPLTEEDENQLMAIAKVHHVKKRQFLVQPGFVADEGEEHTIQFAIEDWFISDFNSYISQTPASLFVEALEESEVLLIPYKEVEELCLHNPKFERFFRMSAQRAFAFSQRRVLSNLDKTAEERFVEFNSLYPHIVARVPQYTLASYLGITPEFLSKIRKKALLKS